MTSSVIHNNGLKDKYQQQIISILSAHPHVSSAWLFGSRAMGTFKPNSDIDIVLEGKQLTLTDLADLLTKIELTTIPYKVDILIKHKIKSGKLLEHIERYGVRWL